MTTVAVVLFSFSGCLLCFSQLYLAADTLNAGEKITSNETLVSIEYKFVLGFFSPSESTRKYLGIWYYGLQPQTVVWVANRDKPVRDSTGVFQIAEDGNLVVSDTDRNIYWSSRLEGSSSSNWTVRLMDSGNLVLRDDQLGMNLWQSFEHPTDTFLPNMSMVKNIQLIFWRSSDDPAPGNFTFQSALEGDNGYIIAKNQDQLFWKSGSLDSEAVPPTIVALLNSSLRSNNLNYSLTRLVMNNTGEILFLRYEDNIESGWSVQWREPADKCKRYNACGNFSSCNSMNNPPCKCLPGFISMSRENESSGELIEGCARKSASCDINDMAFINLTMVEVGRSDQQIPTETEADCISACRNMCSRCQAYSYNASTSDRGSSACLIWTRDLLTLQEESPKDGIDLSVRVHISDILSNAKACKPCGEIMIPYPLSTGPDCGDPMYLKLNCNKVTGQLRFNMFRSNRVTKIDSDNRRLLIQFDESYYCEAKDHDQIDSPFIVTNGCYAEQVIEVSWLPPPEPLCHKSIECKSWPHSTCSATRDGKQRCLCDTNFQWNNLTLNCTQAQSLSGSKEPFTGKNSRALILVVTLLSIGFLACIIVFAFVWRKVAHNKEKESVQRIRGRLYDSERHVKELIDLEELEEKDNEGIEVPYFDFETILAATDNFSDANKLGRGGYGPVYKGRFPGGQDIAIKRLSSVSSQGLKEFKNEVVLIAKLQHRNLVRLRGYCIKGDEKILLYEYMPNKSLDLFIFDSTQSVLLDWQMRFDIILGVARGMLYLHQDSRLRVVHRDLKTSNILLDEEMQPKISDFGLARIFGSKETEANTERVVGTYGYMSPEYALDGIFSTKSDVFSFGIVVLEIISGKKNTGFFQSKQVSSLLGYAWRLWEENKLLDLMDQSISETCNANQFIRCAEVGLLCVQDEPGDRPTMSNVVIMLESEIASLPTPKRPTFFMNRRLSSTASSSKPEIILQTDSSYQEGR